MNFGFQEKIIAAAVGLIVIVAGWYFLFYAPKAAAIERNRLEIEDIQMQIERSITDPALVDSLRKDIERLEQSNAENRTLIIPVDSILYVNETIKRKCGIHNLTITQPLTPDKEMLFGESPEETGESSIRMVEIDVFLRGTFFDLGYFLEDFPSYPFLIRAGEVEINTGDEIYPELEMAIKVYVGFRKV